MEHKFCKDTAVECRFHKKGHPCNECVDITEATNFLLKELKPKSGTLKTGVMNNDYAAYLMTVFSKQFCKAHVIKSLPSDDEINGLKNASHRAGAMWLKEATIERGNVL